MPKLAQTLATDPPTAALTAAALADQRLFAKFYGELHRTARRELRRIIGATLSTTTLLHETYLSLTHGAPRAFRDRDHLMSYAARAMRGLIVDYLRRRRALRHGGNVQILPLTDELPEEHEEVDWRVDKLSEALARLERIDPRLAECFELRFFCGLTFGQIAQLRSVSTRTVRRDWDSARLLLKHFIGDSPVSRGAEP